MNRRFHCHLTFYIFVSQDEYIKWRSFVKLVDTLTLFKDCRVHLKQNIYDKEVTGYVLPHFTCPLSHTTSCSLCSVPNAHPSIISVKASYFFSSLKAVFGHPFLEKAGEPTRL